MKHYQAVELVIVATDPGREGSMIATRHALARTPQARGSVTQQGVRTHHVDVPPQLSITIQAARSTR